MFDPENLLGFNTSHIEDWVKHKLPCILKFKQPCAIQSTVGINDTNYFEVKLKVLPKESSVIVGLSPACRSTDPYQVFGPGSISLEANLGEVRLGNDPYVHTVNSPYSEGDVIGCRFVNFPDQTVTFFKNGVPGTPVRFTCIRRDLRVSIYATPGTTITYNLGETPFQYNPTQFPSPEVQPLDVALPAY
ncbi:Protein ssh4 [Entomophthora muscae]|uniref:Protein ssh4 n=1 Tax=Entomophthora muscae TaxID=34485 RepID=A0ACC2TD64_9FUNG|nr:Protein ssh4 [Entomophthora muscae]